MPVRRISIVNVALELYSYLAVICGSIIVIIASSSVRRGHPVAVAGLWAADHLHVELFVIDDGAPYAIYPDHYKGVYILTEAIERDSNRIDVKVLGHTPVLRLITT